MFLALTCCIACLAIMAPSDSLADEKQGVIATPEEAWRRLENAEKMSPEVLTGAVTFLVKKNHESDLSRLQKLIETETFLACFVYFKTDKRPSRNHPFRNLTREIAKCQTPLAESLLINLAESEAVTGAMKGGEYPKYERSVAVANALGYLTLESDAGYEILEKCLNGELSTGVDIPFYALFRICNERSANIIKRCMFNDEEDWQSIIIPEVIKVLGTKRDRLAMFNLLLALSGEAPSDALRKQTLKALTSPSIRLQDGANKVLPYPKYNEMSKEHRHLLLQKVELLDNSDFSSEANKSLDELKQLLSVD